MQLAEEHPRPAVSAATPADLHLLGQIWLEMMHQHQERDHQFTLAQDGLARWADLATEMLGREDAFLFKAEQHGRAVGFCLGWVAHNPPIYEVTRVGFISEVAVTESARRRGVGTALLAEARRWFAARGLQEFQLSTAVWNSTARRFWESVGGEPLLIRYRFAM